MFKEQSTLKIIKTFFKVRQSILRKIVPEFIWKKYNNFDGVPIPIRSMPFSFGTKLCLSSGNYEIPERILSSLVLEKGMKVIEMGTSIGILSAIIANKIGISGKLVTIEASLKKCNIASSWLLKNYPNVKIINGYAFPCYKLPKGLYVKSFQEEISSLEGKVEYSFGNQEVKDKDSMPLFDIYKIENEYLFDKADLLVVDVEGAEEILFDSEIIFPETLKNIIIETHPWEYSKVDTTKCIISKICSNGFEMIHQIETSYLFSRKKVMTN